MKLNQIVNENNFLEDDLTEAPVSFKDQMIANIGSIFGSSSANAKKDVYNEVKGIYTDLKSFMAGSNIGKNELTPEDMKLFLNKVGYDKNADQIIKSIKRKFKSKPRAPLTAKETESIVLLAVSQAYKEKSKFQRGIYTDPKKKVTNPPFQRSQSSKQDPQPSTQPSIESVATFIKQLTPAQKEELTKLIKN